MGNRKAVEAQNDLVARVRRLLAGQAGVTEKRMFGGHCFLAHGNMIGGVTGPGELIVRVGPVDYQRALQQPDAREMDFTGRPMRGFVVVDRAALDSAETLQRWIEWGLAYAQSLPPKAPK